MGVAAGREGLGWEGGTSLSRFVSHFFFFFFFFSFFGWGRGVWCDTVSK